MVSNQIKTICPGCQRVIVPKGERCPPCAEKHRKRPSVMRPGDPFYKQKPWMTLRLVKLRQDPLCQPCKARGRITQATEVHHIKPRQDFPELALSLINLESCCRSCHSAHTMREQHERRREGAKKS